MFRQQFYTYELVQCGLK